MPPFFILTIKPNLTIDDIVTFLNKTTENGSRSFSRLYVSLPYHSLKEVTEEFSASGIQFGSPYIHELSAESFTGPIAMDLLKNAGAKFALIGSREERKLHSQENFAKKCESALQNNIIPIFCCGESINERKEGKTLETLKDQLEDLKKFSIDNPLIVIYQIPFESFADYLPSAKEIADAYAICQEAVADRDIKDKILWAIELPVDLAGFSEAITNSPFQGFYFVKAGTFPHSVHEEAKELFHIHAAPEK